MNENELLTEDSIELARKLIKRQYKLVQNGIEDDEDYQTILYKLIAVAGTIDEEALEEKFNFILERINRIKIELLFIAMVLESPECFIDVRDNELVIMKGLPNE